MSRKQKITISAVALFILFAIYRSYSWQKGFVLTTSQNQNGQKIVIVEKIPVRSLVGSWIDKYINDDPIAYSYKVSLCWDHYRDVPISVYSYISPYVEGDWYRTARIDWLDSRAFVVTFDQGGPLKLYCRFRELSNDEGSYFKAIWSEIPIPASEIGK